jgi:IMP dehydrogenase
MGYVGCASIDQLKLDTEFIQISAAGYKESHVHDVIITKESPNYQIDTY